MMVIGRFGCVRGSVGCFDWLHGCAVIFVSPGGVRIGYIRRAMCGRSSTDAVTGSLVFFAPLDCLDVYCAAECASCWLFCGTDCVYLANCEIFIWQVGLYWIMAMEGAALVEDHAGITFGVELYVPWDAPEAVVDIHSEGVVPLGSMEDVVGLMRRKAVFCKGGMSAVYVFWFLIRVDWIRTFMMCRLWKWVMCRNRRFPSRSCRYSASSGRLRCFVTCSGFSNDLEVMWADAKKRFRQTKPSKCVYCGTLIKCDMYQHVAKFQLNLTQLWRCPVSWCMVCEGNATGLYGSCFGGARCPLDHEDGSAVAGVCGSAGVGSPSQSDSRILAASNGT